MRIYLGPAKSFSRTSLIIVDSDARSVLLTWLRPVGISLSQASTRYLSFSRRTSSALGWPWVPLFFSKRHSRSRPYQATARSFTVIRRLSGIGTLVYSTRLYTPSYETRRRRPRRYSSKRCPGNHCCPYFISVTGATLALIPVPVQNGLGGQGRRNVTAIRTSTNRRARLNIYLTYETHTLG